MAATKNPVLLFFSRIFPRKRDLAIRVSTSSDGNLAYVEPILELDGSYHRFEDLRNVPDKIKVGSRYVRISKKNRHTLRQLADWDPKYDSQKGFVFPEKDVPEVLNYLRPKATIAFSAATQNLTVDNRPLEYVHEITGTPAGVEIKTLLSDADSKIRIESLDQARFPEGSKFVHAADGYYRSPAEKKYQAFHPTLGTAILSGDQIPIFLLYDLQRLESETRAHVSPDVASQRVITQPFEPNVSLHVDGSWLTFDVRYQADRFNIPYEQVATSPSRQQFLRDDNTWIRIDQSKHAEVSHQISQIPELEKLEGRFRAPTRHFQEIQALLEQVAKINASDAYATFYRSLQDFSQIQSRPLPYSLKGELRSYQKHGFDWACFLRQYGLNGILADDMGLGKTVQTLTVLLDTHALAGAKTSLVVCPPSVLSAWEKDIKQFTSTIDFRTARYFGVGRQGVLAHRDHYDALFTTYSVLTRDIEHLSNIAWEYVILDEAQKIKNHETATAKACRRLVAKHKLAVTGTPIENRLSELWSIYDFLMPSYLGTKSEFRDKYEVPVMKLADQKAAEALKKKISPFKLRRLKSQVTTELPPKISLDRYCELTPEQVQLYKKYAFEQSERIKQLPGQVVKMNPSIFAALMRLKQICCHPALVTGDFERIHKRSGKLDAFLEIVDEIIEGGEKAVVFSQFTEMHRILRKVLEEKQISYFYLDGSTPEKSRAELIRRFQAGECSFFLISLRAGGVGITLTEASCVVHYDRWWNPAVEDQATDRTHRLGQKKIVKVFRIHTLGTIEDRIGELLVKKRDLFDSVMEADDLKKEITKEELLALFAPPSK